MLGIGGVYARHLAKQTDLDKCKAMRPSVDVFDKPPTGSADVTVLDLASTGEESSLKVQDRNDQMQADNQNAARAVRKSLKGVNAPNTGCSGNPPSVPSSDGSSLNLDDQNKQREIEVKRVPLSLTRGLGFYDKSGIAYSVSTDEDSDCINASSGHPSEGECDQEQHLTNNHQAIPRKLYDKSTIVSEMTIQEQDFCNDEGNTPIQGFVGSSRMKGSGFCDKSVSTDDDSDYASSLQASEGESDPERDKASTRQTVPRKLYDRSTAVSEMTIHEEDFVDDGACMPSRGGLTSSLARGSGFYDKSGNTIHISGSSDDSDFETSLAASDIESDQEHHVTDKRQPVPRRLYDRSTAVSEMTIHEEEFHRDDDDMPMRRDLTSSLVRGSGFYDKSGNSCVSVSTDEESDYASSLAASEGEVDPEQRLTENRQVVPRKLYDRSTAVSEMTIHEENFSFSEAGGAEAQSGSEDADLGSSFSKLFGGFSRARKSREDAISTYEADSACRPPPSVASKGRNPMNRMDRLQRRLCDKATKTSDLSIASEALDEESISARTPRRLYDKKNSEQSLSIGDLCQPENQSGRLQRRLYEKSKTSDLSLTIDDLSPKQQQLNSGRMPRRLYDRSKTSDLSLGIDDLVQQKQQQQVKDGRSPRRLFERSKNSELSLSIHKLDSSDPNIVDGIKPFGAGSRRNSRRRMIDKRTSEMSLCLDDFASDIMEGSFGASGMSGMFDRRSSLDSNEFPLSGSDFEQINSDNSDVDSDGQTQEKGVRFHPKIESIISYEGPRLADYALLYYNKDELQAMIDDFQQEESRMREEARQARHAILRNQIPDAK